MIFQFRRRRVVVFNFIPVQEKLYEMSDWLEAGVVKLVPRTEAERYGHTGI